MFAVALVVVEERDPTGGGGCDGWSGEEKVQVWVDGGGDDVCGVDTSRLTFNLVGDVMIADDIASRDEPDLFTAASARLSRPTTVVRFLPDSECRLDLRTRLSFPNELESCNDELAFFFR